MEAMWPIKWPNDQDAPSTEKYSSGQIELAKHLAIDSLRMLTLDRVGIVALRAEPNLRLDENTYQLAYFRLDRLLARVAFPASRHLKYGPGAQSRMVQLISPVHEILSVSVNGEELDPSEYQVLNKSKLHRKEGFWPTGAEGEFTVDYLQGHPVPLPGQYAAGYLALEFLKGMEDHEECRLPRGVTNIVRQGVSIQISSGIFPDGMTGIPEVDAFIMRWNPNALKMKPTVFSPDAPRGGYQW